MKQLARHRLLVAILLFAVVLSTTFTPVFAATYSNSMKLGPASGTSQPGQTFTVSVDGAVGWSLFSTVNLSGTITYPKDLLKVESINKNNSTFYSVNNVEDNKAGTITFNQGNWLVSANNQPIHMFIITFRSLANGMAPVNFGSASYNSGTATTTGAVYTISTPPPAPTPSPSTTPKPAPTPSPSTKPSTTTKPSSTPVTPAPTPIVLDPEETPAPVLESDGGIKIENVKTTITRQKNSVTWTVNKPDAPPKVYYGTSKGTMKSEVAATKLEDGSYEATFDNLKLGTLYYFSIKATTADNLQGTSYIDNFVTRGYPVQLTIQQNSLLLPSAKVKIGERTFTANKDAIITTELGDGSHEAIILAGDSTTSASVKFVVQKKPIPTSGNPELQSFVLNSSLATEASTANGSLILLFIGGAIALLATIGGVIGFILYKRRTAQNNPEPAIDTDLLTTSYGPAFSDTRVNTPEPNLDMTATLAEPAIAPAQDLDIASQAVSPSPSTAPLSEPPLNTNDVTATNLPAEQPITQDIVDIPSDQLNQDEQLSAEIAYVESAESELAESNEPSAVYDETTGELDIIHHHASNTPPPAPQNIGPALPLPPPVPSVTAVPKS